MSVQPGAQLTDVEPRVLVDFHALSSVGRHHALKAVLLVCQGSMVIWSYEGVSSRWFGEDPDLQEPHVFVGVVVFLAVHDACPGAHDLNVAFANHGLVAHAVLVFQIARQRDADDLHVVVRMGAKPCAARDGVVVQDAKRAEMHALGVPPTGEAEAVVGVEPAVVGMASRVCRVKDGLHGALGLGDAGHGQNAKGHEKGSAVEVHVEVCRQLMYVQQKYCASGFNAQKRGAEAPL